MDAKEFYEYQLNDKTSVVGRQDKDEIIMLMEEYHKYKVKNLNITDVVWRSEQLKAYADFLSKTHSFQNYSNKDLAIDYCDSL